MKRCMRGNLRVHERECHPTRAVSSFLLISTNRPFNILWVTQRVTCSLITSRELASLPGVKNKRKGMGEEHSQEKGARGG